jgi:hypothetical protein
VTELLGKAFYIPEYQRGYRWTNYNVLQLLNDIWEYRQKRNNQDTFYCLQPVVVRLTEWKDASNNTVEGYELIDGQQRLTTIHRIITYLMREHLRSDLRAEGYADNLFSIYYKTRPESQAFLESNDYRDDIPDLYYMSEAYRCIKAWCEDVSGGRVPRQVREEMLKILLPGIIKQENGYIALPEWSVQVIWYEIKDQAQKSEALFTRLNRGKIPLTSAELIKAKFVNAESFDGIDHPEKIRRRTQLIQIWDEIESQLNNPRFWAFISNESIEKYHNKIEYLFDIEVGKRSHEKDPLFSFIHFFDPVESAESLWSKWLRVEEIYRSLVFWYSNKELYHRIGYLIATGTPIKKLIKKKKVSSKTIFDAEVNKLISKTIPLNWYELRYDNTSDHEKIIKVLLLVNIELTRENENNNDFFPFDAYKSITQSLEHIHAQNIESVDVTKSEQWVQWLEAHIDVLPAIATDIEEAKIVIQEAKNLTQQINYKGFQSLSARILALIPTESGTDSEFLHTIQNMALLGLTQNISLSNSVFEVKRKKIITMDMSGAFIPPATKRVFLKYYAEESSQNRSLWTAHERTKYLEDMKRCLKGFTTENTNEYAE